MSRLLATLILSTALAGSAFAADVPAYIGKYVSTPADTAAIEKVITDFQTAIKTKNPLLLSSLLVNNRILFSSPAPPGQIKMVNEKFDANFDGLRNGGAEDFIQFIGSEKKAIEERFFNVKIVQDGHAAFVTFDYDFLEDGAVTNYGIETWQMMKSRDGKWKIASVYWTMNFPPKAK